MLKKLTELNRSAWFWITLIVLCFAQEAVALYYQYVLHYDPCMLCVHIRAWVMAIMLLAILGLFLRNSRIGLVITNLLMLSAAGGMLERAYMTLGTERGWVDGSCGDLESGYPTWLPLDQWWPAMFQPLEACGLTPWLIQQVMSMADALMLLSGGLVLVMLVLFLNSIRAAVSE
uniref:Disulfide bond formation protein DsbB n=1 Tax=uncultured Thiotrichaceae bacterium TaxID=298394 RepID=A0A6S6UG23_9GAMM|nr:MAG: Disulfide bond formation protein DsbB [uncultured Thiotrichaceae bacterium]